MYLCCRAGKELSIGFSFFEERILGKEIRAFAQNQSSVKKKNRATHRATRERFENGHLEGLPEKNVYLSEEKLGKSEGGQTSESIFSDGKTNFLLKMLRASDSSLPVPQFAFFMI